MKFTIGAAVLAACLCLTLAAPFEDTQTAVPLIADTNYRLPTVISPQHYNLTLTPYLLETDGTKRFTFDGDLYLTIRASAATTKLALHVKNLTISQQKYWLATTPNTILDIPTATQVYNATTDIMTYTLATALNANTDYVLHFVYTGLMGDDMHGFYRSSYADSKNNTKWLGSTQFQTNHARRAFPSFDEPRFKANFTVALVRHKSLKTVSNTRILRSVATDNTSYIADHYATTPKMSTYLLAFIVSEFNERTNGDFGIVARPEYYQQTEYAHEAGEAILKEFDNYLGHPYYTLGIDKMHMAAIPDFSAGAMENWGLLTYRERALLYDEGSTTLSAQQYIAAVIAHEQAHMWFGDLVTCEWWSWTWLNEGFARYFQYFLTQKVESHYQLDQQFVVDQVQVVMNMDSTNSTNPMSDLNTNSPADLSRMFNSISYNKGGSFIRMVQHVIGENSFQNSLTEYLETHKYQNTIPANLFAIWKKYVPAEFNQYADGLFTSFTEQVGYPVITFNRTTNTTVIVSQKRFLLKDQNSADPNLLYTVPVTYTTSGEKDFEKTTSKFFLTPTVTTQTLTVASNIGWIIGNIQETGYYRVNYDTASWHQIHHALLTSNWGDIHALNRAQVVDDLFNLARSGEIDYDLALSVLEYLATETNYLPWTAAFNGYNFLLIRLGLDTNDFARYIRDLTTKAYNELGFVEKANDTTLAIYNRAKILAWACKFGKSQCIATSKQYFNDLTNKPVPVNIRSVVYCTAMREGNEADFDKLFQKYQNETVATEETLILNSLGCVKAVSLVTKYFNIIMSAAVRRQDKSSALSSLYTENNENVEVVFDLVAADVDKVATEMGGISSVATVISNIASRFTTEDQANKLKKFNTDNKTKFGTSYSTLEAAEKAVAENLDWATNKLGSFKSFLRVRGNGSASLQACTFTLVLVALVAMLFK